jgi:hypothetical protein
MRPVGVPIGPAGLRGRGDVHVSEVRPLWRRGGKPLSQLNSEELIEAIHYLAAHDESDVALLRALRNLRAERTSAGPDPADEHDDSDPALRACG